MHVARQAWPGMHGPACMWPGKHGPVCIWPDTRVRVPGQGLAGCAGSSHGANGLGLRPALALRDVEFDPLPLLKAAVAIHQDGGVVHEHVPATVDRDEVVALVRVEPLDGALSHYSTTP